jgi:hypothetical protein
VGAAPASFSVAFNVEGVTFTTESATLKSGTVFSVGNASLDNEGTRLLVTALFTPVAEQEYIDTLLIATTGANPFELPLRGEGIGWAVAPVELQDFGRLAVGETSEPKSVTITGSNVAGAFSYSLRHESDVFSVTPATGYTAADGGELEVRFAPATAGAVYADTLIIVSEGSTRSYEIALSGATEPVAVASELSFDQIYREMQMTYRIQVVLPVGKQGKRPVLSLNKALKTMSSLFDRLMEILRTSCKRAMTIAWNIEKRLSKNHELESKKKKRCLPKIIELFICISEK